MAKLVEDPLEAAPFLGELIPAFVDVIATIPDPEARKVAEETHEAMLDIQAKAKEIDAAKVCRSNGPIHRPIHMHSCGTQHMAMVHSTSQ